MFVIWVRGDAYDVSETELRAGEAKRPIRFRGTCYVVCKNRFPTKQDALNFMDDFQIELRRARPYYLRFAACKALVESLETLGWDERELRERARSELMGFASQVGYKDSVFE